MNNIAIRLVVHSNIFIKLRLFLFSQNPLSCTAHRFYLCTFNAQAYSEAQINTYTVTAFAEKESSNTNTNTVRLYEPTILTTYQHHLGSDKMPYLANKSLSKVLHHSPA